MGLLTGSESDATWGMLFRSRHRDDPRLRVDMASLHGPRAEGNQGKEALCRAGPSSKGRLGHGDNGAGATATRQCRRTGHSEALPPTRSDSTTGEIGGLNSTEGSEQPCLKQSRKSLNIGAPGEIRTPDPLVRSQVLYPTELRARCRGDPNDIGGPADPFKGRASYHIFPRRQPA